MTALARAVVCGRGLNDDDVTKLCHQERLAEAVEALGVFVQTESWISTALFYSVLKKCVGKRDLVLGRLVHALTVWKGYGSDTFLCNHFLRMYAAHGSLEEAMDVFTGVAGPDVFMWSSMISAHVKYGQDTQALELYHGMRRSSVKPDGFVFVAALKACARGADLENGQRVHADVLASELEGNLFVCSSLVDMYAKCGSLEDARRVFDEVDEKDVVLWNAMIAGYSQQGMGQEVLGLYNVMQEEGTAAPDAVTFSCILQACATIGAPALEQGKQLHAQIEDHGYDREVLVANSLINMYVKCGILDEARTVFDGLVGKDVVTWNAMLAGYAQQGMGQETLGLFSAMEKEVRVAPDSVTFVCLLQACACLGIPGLEKGKQIHARIHEQGLQGNVFVASSLLDMYAKCGSVEDARVVFDGLGEKNVVTWSAMIAGYSQQGMGQGALLLYRAMQEEGMVAPDAVTFVSLLQACASVGAPALEEGRHLHAQIREGGFDAEVSVAGTLVDMYAKCGSIEDAQALLKGISEKDVVTRSTKGSELDTFLCNRILQMCASHARLQEIMDVFTMVANPDAFAWSAVISAHVKHGLNREAIELYHEMCRSSVHPNGRVFVAALQACASSADLKSGQQVHADLLSSGVEPDLFVCSCLVDMYAKCCSLEEAQNVFDRLPEKDLVTWSTMITGYSQHGMGQEALGLYSSMLEDGISELDSVTFVCLLQACACVGDQGLDMGRQLHAQIREQGLQADVFVASSLINMYGKCGSIEDARNVFDRASQKNVVMWNAMIAGYAQQGMEQETLGLYRAMQQEGLITPDSVTFVCLLLACASLAALHLGRQLHSHIEQHGLQADVTLVHSLINMYAKSGSMVDAQQVFESQPTRVDRSWNALIAGYTHQGDSFAVFDLLHRMKKDGIPPTGITFLSVLTVCSHAGLVNKGLDYFSTMSSEYGISPTAEHYTCMVDLMGRAGELDDALALVRTMPTLPDPAVWHTLLGACRKWNNVQVGRHAFDEAMKLDGQDAAAYLLMLNIYTAAQMWEQVQEIQARRTGSGAQKQPGQCWWTDMDGVVHSFLVQNRKIPKLDISGRLLQLTSKTLEIWVCVGHRDLSSQVLYQIR